MSQQQQPSSWYARKWPWVIGGFAAFLIAISVISTSHSGPTGSTSTYAAAPDVSYEQATTVLPSPTEFSIGVNVLRKKCFGQFGCNITYQIDPHYTGQGQLLPSQPLRVVYEVIGDKSGTQINNFTVLTNGTASFPSEEFATTPAEGVTLIARATSVSTN